MTDYKNNDFEGFLDDICNTRQLLEEMFDAFNRNVKGPDRTENVLKILVMSRLLNSINALKDIERIWEI